eukprot:COSAG01_NODE_26161_length_722_cov_0.924559_1_plen_46_part_10
MCRWDTTHQSLITQPEKFSRSFRSVFKVTGFSHDHAPELDSGPGCT